MKKTEPKPHLFDEPHIYADLAATHRGDYPLYDAMVGEIYDAGAIPKLQLYSLDTFPREWAPPARFVASVFRPEDVDFIAPFEPLALKVASVESLHVPLLRRCLDTFFPLIVSTGGMVEDELLTLIELVGEHKPGVCLMHCVSEYPTAHDHSHLLRIPYLVDLCESYAVEDIELGWSCHNASADGLVSMAMAFALGATQIEVHVKPDDAGETPDELSAFTMKGLAGLTYGLKRCESLLGPEWWEKSVPPDRAAVLEWRKRWMPKS